jgi:hypothetical protein
MESLHTWRMPWCRNSTSAICFDPPSASLLSSNPDDDYSYPAARAWKPGFRYALLVVVVAHGAHLFQVPSSPTSGPAPSLGMPTDDDIEAIIQMATSARPSSRVSPLKDTRTQLFVGNVRPPLHRLRTSLIAVLVSDSCRTE